MKLLIVAPSWIGDTIMAEPMLARLRDRYPTARFDALAPAWVAPVLRRMAGVQTVFDSPFGHGQISLKARWRLARSLAAQGYDAAYILPNSLKSALVPWLAGIPRRIGFTGESRYGLINIRHTLDKQALPRMVERFAQLAEAPGTPPAQPISLPRIQSTVEAQNAALARLGLSRPDSLVIFCPGAEYGPAKRWPAAHFSRLACDLSAEGKTLWLLGSPKDAAIAEEISQGSGGLARNLCGQTRLDEAIDLLAMASLVVCNDSGLMHVAAALDRPLVTLFGSSSPEFTPPLSTQADILTLGLSCSPCFKRVCPLGHLNCLQQLTPERVLAACLARIAP